MQKEHHYGRNIFFTILIILTISCIVIMNMIGEPYDYLMNNYLGVIIPLHAENSALTCERKTFVQINNSFLIEDTYYLNNTSQENQTVKLYYPQLDNYINSQNMKITINNKSIDYQYIYNYQYIDKEEYSNKSVLSFLKEVQDTSISKELEANLSREVYVYEFVDRHYQEDGPIKYMKIEYSNHPKTYYFELENEMNSESKDNVFYINMNNNEFARTPRIISWEKIEDIKLTGYKDHTLQEIDRNVTANINEKKISFKDAIELCLDDNYKQLNIKTVDKESYIQSYLKGMDIYLKENKSLDNFNINKTPDKIYYYIYNEIDIPAHSTVSIQYQYNNYSGQNYESEENNGMFHYMTRYDSNLDFTEQTFNIVFYDEHSIKENDMGLTIQSRVQEKELALDKDIYYVKLKK